MAEADEAAGAAPSTLPMLAGAWRSEGVAEDLGSLASRHPLWQRGPRRPAPEPGPHRSRWWKRAAMALLPLLAVVVAAALWMELPH
jgi:hypothetical protein